MSDAPAAAPAGSPGAPEAAPQQGQPAPGQKPGETPAQAERRRLKLMLDGQETELDESEVVANFKKGRNAAQLVSRADQKRADALRAKAEAEGLLSKLKADPVAALRELGVDPRTLSEKVILEAIEEEKLTPEQRQLREKDARIKAYEEEKRKAQEAKQSEALERETQEHVEKISDLFVGTMEALGLPRSSGRHVLPRMARVYMHNEEAGLESTPEEMAAHVLEGIKAEQRGLLSGLEGEALLEHLGPDTVKRILAAHLAKVRAQRGQPARQEAPPAAMPQRPASGLHPRKGRWAEIDKLTR